MVNFTRKERQKDKMNIIIIITAILLIFLFYRAYVDEILKQAEREDKIVSYKKDKK